MRSMASRGEGSRGGADPAARETAAAELRMSIQRTSAEVHAGGRVAEALYGVAIDMLGPTLDQDLSYHQRARLLRTLDVPVGEVARRAIEALEAELAIALGEEPSPVTMTPATPGIVTTAGRVSRLDFE